MDQVPSADDRRVWGEALRRGRLEAGLQVDDVARRLNLRTSFVEAVEEGRGDDHMDWVYERNHLRSIALMLRVSLTGMEIEA